jgi:hypothetical protein
MGVGRMNSERIARVIWIRLETPEVKIHEERAETQSRIHKVREQEISDVVKNPRKIELEIESSPLKVADRKYLQNKWEEHTSARGQESSASVPNGGLTARAAKEDKNDTEIPRPKIQKIDGTNYKIDSTRINCRCSKSWKHRGGTHTIQTQTERRKECWQNWQNWQ